MWSVSIVLNNTDMEFSPSSQKVLVHNDDFENTHFKMSIGNR